MGSAAAIRAGRAFIEIGTDNNPLVKGLKHSTKLLNDYASRAASFGTKMIATGAALLSPWYMAIEAGSDMQETMNKFDVVFGDSTKAVKAWGDEYGGAVGRSKRQIADFMASNQDLLVPMGFEEDAATEMSKQITQLSVDLASFNNKQDTDTLNDLQAALTGSGEVMKKYGVIVSQAAVNQELLNMGMSPKTATEAQKAQARFNIILRGTTAAQGDAIRSANSWANQKKALAATIENVSGAIGGKLLPIVTPLLMMFKDGVRTVGEFISQNAGLVVALAGTGAGLVVLGGAILGVAFGIKVAAIAVGVLTTVLGAVLSPMGLLIAGLAALVYYSGAGGKALDWLSSRFGWLGEFASETFGDIKQALNAGEFKLAAQLLWASVKHVWYRGTNDLFDNISEWKKSFLEIWDGAIDHASSYFIDEWAMLQTAWVKITQFFGDAWDIVVNSIVDKWKNAQNYIADTALDVILALDPSINKEDARAELQEMQEREKQSRNSALNNRILERDQQTQAELKEIEDARQGAQQANAEESQRKADMREQELKQARAERERRLAQTSEEIAAIRNEISLLPKPEETNLGQTAAAGGGGVKSTAAFKASTTAKAGGDGPVNLRSEAGVKLLADLFNDSGQDKTLKELETSNGLLGEIAAVLDARLLRTAGA